MAEPVGFEPGLPMAVPVGVASELGDRGAGFARIRPGSGSGSPIVLLHGITASSGINWLHVFEALPSDRVVIAPDLRGHGRGPGARRGTDVGEMAGDVVALLDGLGVPTATVVGFSMGGAVAQQLVLDHPTRVDALVLLATTSRFRMDRRRRWAYGLPAAAARATAWLPDPVRDRVLPRFVPHPDPGVRRFIADETARHVPWQLTRVAGALSRFRTTPRLGEISVPTAVVVTTEDTTVHPNAQHRLADLIPDSRVFECHAGHSGLLWQPEVTVPALVGALASLAPR